MEFDREFWDRHGYVHVKQAVPGEQLAGVIRDMERFTGKQFADKGQWYREPLGGGGMVNMSNSPAEWQVRTHPSVYETFRGIWGRDDLWVTINRTNFNPPVGPDWDHPGFIHWDLDPSLRPIQFRVQGVLYLADTDENMGGFQCVPGSHRKLEEWHATHPESEVPTEDDCMKGLEVKKIAGKAGDLIIWQASLLHGNGRNTSDRPRLAQYICMTPAGTSRAGAGLMEGGDDLVEARVETWRLAGYQRGVAEALDVPEAWIEHWLGAMISGQEIAREAAPSPGYGSALSPADGERFLAEVERLRPWEGEAMARAHAAVKRYGTTASYFGRALLASQLAAAIERGFGIPIANEVPRLKEVGKRLLGVLPW